MPVDTGPRGRHAAAMKPIAKAEMLIRRPVTEVFEAFANPAITSKFWFSHGSGRLEAGKRVNWTWEMYDFSISVEVVAIEPDRRIQVAWMAFGKPTPIEWRFNSRPDHTTFVTVINHDFPGSETEAVQGRSIPLKDLPSC